MLIKRLLNVSLQTKITGLVVGINVLLTLMLIGIFAYFDAKQITENKNNLSLQTAKALSFMPIVKESVGNGTSSSSVGLQILSDQYTAQSDADFIVIQDRDGNVLGHNDDESIESFQAFDDGYAARVYGGYYNLESDEFVGKAIMGKAPVLSDTGNVIGVVSVGFLKKNISKEIWSRLDNVLYFSIAVFVISLFASFLLAKHIRKEILGLEPREIATLYRDRMSILSSINEGVIATDASGLMTLINDSAKVLLNTSDLSVNKPIESILPQITYENTIGKQRMLTNEEVYINNKVIIVNMVPIMERSQMVGTVTTFKDKTDIQDMVNTLSEVKQYSDDLRAQTHEFSNRMYVISALLQLEKYEEAKEMVQEEAMNVKISNRLIFSLIEDFKMQAILLGKMSKASEKKISFVIDENSSMKNLPPHIEMSHIITIVGNLVDNAFEAVMDRSGGYVSFFAIDIGKDIIFEISDNGGGFQTDTIEEIFTMEYTTKSEKKVTRGYGLFNVKEVLDILEGSIQVDSDEKGTTISVYIPKSIKGNSHDTNHRR